MVLARLAHNLAIMRTLRFLGQAPPIMRGKPETSPQQRGLECNCPKNTYRITGLMLMARTFADWVSDSRPALVTSGSRRAVSLQLALYALGTPMLTQYRLARGAGHSVPRQKRS
jgi:hypothetical protein